MAAYGILGSLLLLLTVTLTTAEQHAFSDSYLAAAEQIVLNLLDQYHYTHGPGAPPEATPPPAPALPSGGESALPRGPPGAGPPPPPPPAAAEGAAPEPERPSTRQRLHELHGVLSGEARRQSVAKAEGFSDALLRWLGGTSQLGAAGQLRAALEKVLEKGEARRDASRRLVEEDVRLLEDPHSGFSRDLAQLRPLPYSL